jgi:hypothetical protein
MTVGKIKIECEGSGLIDISEMSEFQDDIKDLSRGNFLKLKNHIINNGYSFPICVWQNGDSYYILDGHQRKRVLTKMREEGFEVPPVPVSMVRAVSFEQAKRKLLAGASQFGNINSQGMHEFLLSNNIEFEEMFETMAFADLSFDKFQKEYYDVPNPDVDDLVHVEPEYLVIIKLDNEPAQSEIFDELNRRGYQCKLMS